MAFELRPRNSSANVSVQLCRSAEYNFKTAPAVGDVDTPIKIGIFGDIVSPFPHMMQVAQTVPVWIEESLSAHAAPFSACISSTCTCAMYALYVTFVDDSVLQGETYNSSDTVQHLIKNKPEMILNMVR